MGQLDYEKAYRLGIKEYQQKLSKGEEPTLPSLDEILPPKSDYVEYPLGLVEIPIEQIVGTKTNNRSNAFAGNFMPLLDINSEFGMKWCSLSTSHVEEGIRDPIKAYEYMNKFYVEEGNKRVSVMKYFGVTFITGEVTRIIPKRTDEPESILYFEFLDFYKDTEINYIWFSKKGSFIKLQKLVGKEPGEVWSEEEKKEFRSIYLRFKQEYEKKNDSLAGTTGDAFLTLIEVYGYEALSTMSTFDLKDTIGKSKEEFKLLGTNEDIDLKLDPNEKKSIFGKLLSLGSPKLTIAFIYEKTPSSSAWTYAHELGRIYLEQTFKEEVSTIFYENVTQESIEDILDDAIAKNCNIIFTTTPAFTQASVKAAIEHPNVRILNCSLNTSHRYIRSYYARMHEAKFLMGAIAGAMAENDKISYVADYPIYGTIANINAFVLGAQMINPRAKVYLEWNCLKDRDVEENIRKISPSCISSRDMLIPEQKSKYFGLYHVEDGKPYRLAMPLVHWGKFYEKLIRTILDGTWKYDDESTDKAINYWWGMSAGVIDVIFSQNIPIGTKRLIDLLKETIMNGEFNPFTGILYSQEGVIQDDPDKIMSPEEIATINWLAQNIIGHIPTKEELLETAIPVVTQQGIDKKG